MDGGILIAPEVSLSALDAMCAGAVGFSGRQLAKMMLALQAAAYGGAALGKGGGAVLGLDMLGAVLAREKQKLEPGKVHRAQGRCNPKTDWPLV